MLIICNIVCWKKIPQQLFGCSPWGYCCKACPNTLSFHFTKHKIIVFYFVNKWLPSMQDARTKQIVCRHFDFCLIIVCAWIPSQMRIREVLKWNIASQKKRFQSQTIGWINSKIIVTLTIEKVRVMAALIYGGILFAASNSTLQNCMIILCSVKTAYNISDVDPLNSSSNMETANLWN